MWVLGLTFLENYYTIYDMDQGRVGIAKSKSYDTRNPSESQNYFFFLALLTASISIAYLLLLLINKAIKGSQLTPSLSLNRLKRWRSRRPKLRSRVLDSDINHLNKSDDNISLVDLQKQDSGPSSTESSPTDKVKLSIVKRTNGKHKKDDSIDDI